MYLVYGFNRSLNLLFVGFKRLINKRPKRLNLLNYHYLEEQRFRTFIMFANTADFLFCLFKIYKKIA